MSPRLNEPTDPSDFQPAVPVPESESDDASWLEEGGFSTPDQAAEQLGLTPETVRAWARAGYIRHLADGKPIRFLLCDEDVDELHELLRGVRRPTLALVRALVKGRGDVRE